MIDQRDINTAVRFGFLDWLQKFHEELLKVPDVVDVDYDLDGFFSSIDQVICIVKYDIRATRDDYWDARTALRKSVIGVAKDFNLYKTGDRIEDYGEHFYFVFGCEQVWKCMKYGRALKEIEEKYPGTLDKAGRILKKLLGGEQP